MRQLNFRENLELLLLHFLNGSKNEKRGNEKRTLFVKIFFHGVRTTVGLLLLATGLYKLFLFPLLLFVLLEDGLPNMDSGST